MEDQNSKQQFLLGLFGGVAVVSVIGLIIMGIMLVNPGDKQGGVAGQQDQAPETQNPGVQAPVQTRANVAGVNTFSEKQGAEICREDGKPVVYLFSTTWCPHCTWINDTFNSTVQKYVDSGDIVAYHWEVDINDDVLTSEKETSVPPAHLAVYKEFNPGGSIPTFVFGCKYSRIGNGYEAQNDLGAEVAEFEALIEDLIK